MSDNNNIEATLWKTADKLLNNMDAIEKDNPIPKVILPKDYATPASDKQRLGELIDLIGSITLSGNGTGSQKGRDVLDFVFEYFPGQFADAEGKKGGQFYTPPSIVKLLDDQIRKNLSSIGYRF